MELSKFYTMKDKIQGLTQGEIDNLSVRNYIEILADYIQCESFFDQEDIDLIQDECVQRNKQMKKLTESLVKLELKIYTINFNEIFITQRDNGLDKELIKKIKDVI